MPTIDKTVTVGNIVSWVMIVVAMAVGWTRLQTANEQNAKDVAAAVLLAKEVDNNQRLQESRRDAQINALTVTVAVTEATVKSIDKKIDEVLRRDRVLKE